KVHVGACKHLRKIRRGAGEARDWDVLLAILTERCRERGSKPRAGFDCLVGYVVAKREAAQRQLEQAGADFPFAFDRLLAETVAAVHKPDDSSHRCLLDLARPWLTAALAKLNHAADQNLEAYEQLHQVRIFGKRLRYAMEVFAACFAREFREHLYVAVEEMQ